MHKIKRKYLCGEKIHILNGKLHNLEGPAIIRPDGTKMWYIKGDRLTEFSWKYFREREYECLKQDIAIEN